MRRLQLKHNLDWENRDSALLKRYQRSLVKAKEDLVLHHGKEIDILNAEHQDTLKKKGVNLLSEYQKQLEKERERLKSEALKVKAKYQVNLKSVKTVLAAQYQKGLEKQNEITSTRYQTILGKELEKLRIQNEKYVQSSQVTVLPLKKELILKQQGSENVAPIFQVYSSVPRTFGLMPNAAPLNDPEGGISLINTDMDDEIHFVSPSVQDLLQEGSLGGSTEDGQGLLEKAALRQKQEERLQGEVSRLSGIISEQQSIIQQYESMVRNLSVTIESVKLENAGMQAQLNQNN